MLDLEVMRLAFAAGAIVGVLAPVVGFFLVQRQLSLIGDGIGHVAFAEVAAGYLLGISPVWTALAAAGVGAGIAGGVVPSAAGALNANLFVYPFGSILTVTRGDLLTIALLASARSR
jgi:zinc transport system permease protein